MRIHRPRVNKRLSHPVRSLLKKSTARAITESKTIVKTKESNRGKNKITAKHMTHCPSSSCPCMSAHYGLRIFQKETSQFWSFSSGRSPNLSHTKRTFTETRTQNEINSKMSTSNALMIKSLKSSGPAGTTFSVSLIAASSSTTSHGIRLLPSRWLSTSPQRSPTSWHLAKTQLSQGRRLSSMVFVALEAI